MSPRLSSEPKLSVACPNCGGRRHVTRTHARRMQTGEYVGLCDRCRYPARINVTQRHRNYWLNPAVETDGRPIHDGYTLAECRELAAGLESLLGDHSRYARGRRKEAA